MDYETSIDILVTRTSDKYKKYLVPLLCYALTFTH